MGFLTPQAAGEHEVLKTFALQQLAQLRTSIHGLTDDEAHATPVASALNLTGLLRHCGAVAVFWSACAASAPEPPRLPEDLAGADRLLEELIADPSSLDETLAFFDRCVEVTRANLKAVTDLGAPVPIPDAPWFPRELESWEARWCLAHISAEVARHAGHADVIRESIDGRDSFELNELAEATA